MGVLLQLSNAKFVFRDTNLRLKYTQKEAVGTDMPSVVVTVDEDYDLMHDPEVRGIVRDAYALACLGDLQSNDTQTFLLTLETTCSSDTYENLSELQGNPTTWVQIQMVLPLYPLRVLTSVCPVVLAKWS